MDNESKSDNESEAETEEDEDNFFNKFVKYFIEIDNHTTYLVGARYKQDQRSTGLT